MKKNEILSVKSTLGKQRKSSAKPRRVKNEFTITDDSIGRLKKVIVILPIIIIAILVIILIVGIHQYTSMFAETPLTPAQESSTSRLISPADESKLLLIISPDNPLPSDYRINLKKYEGYEVDELLLAPLKELMNDADKDGLFLKVAGGFVSAEQQHEKYMDEVRRLMAREGYGEARAMEEAEKTVPMENHSELQSGLAVKFSSLKSANFSQSAEFLWLKKNAYKYGFILRYPQGKESSTDFAFDATHFRYVGTENALRMHSQNMCLDEYVTYLNSRL